MGDGGFIMGVSLILNLWSALRIRKASNFDKAETPKAIPRRIHQLWIPPSHLEAIPDDVRPQVGAWKNYHPDFEHRIWTIEEVAASIPAQSAARMTEALKVCRFEAMKADIVRLYLLYEHGGFWSDLKVFPRRRWLDEYLDSELLLVEHFKFEQLPNPTGVLTNNLIGARSKNPFIGACIERVHANIDRRLSTTVWHVAGIKIYMDIYEEWRSSYGQSPPGVVLTWDYVWSELVGLGYGSYSADHRHWSVREKNEPIYLE